MYPLLSLSQIALNPELVQRLPRRLAYYHLALPIAEDEDGITVAMAHPDNHLAVEVLETILKSPIIAVRCFADEIKSALDCSWSESDEAHPPGGLVWTDTPSYGEYVSQWTDMLTPALSLRFATAEDSPVDHACETTCNLLVAALTEPRNLAIVLSQSPSPLLLVRGEARPPKRILQVLRGHTPDRKALDWVIPIAHHWCAQVTVLSASVSMLPRHTNPVNADFSSLTARVSEYGRILASVGVQGRLKIRQGTLEKAILEELRTGAYDLVAIAVEAYGDFVFQVLQQLSNTNNTSAFLIVKP